MPQRAAYSGILDLSRLTFRSPERASPGILVRGASSCGIGPGEMRSNMLRAVPVEAFR
jgi:hypothetical protein